VFWSIKQNGAIFLTHFANLGQSVEINILSTCLDFLAAINGYSQRYLPKTLVTFLPGKPLLLALPIINAQIINLYIS